MSVKQQLEERLKSLSDEARIRVIRLLGLGGRDPFFMTELAESLKISPTTLRKRLQQDLITLELSSRWHD